LDQFGKKSLLTELLGEMAGNGIFAGIALIPGNTDFFIELNAALRVLQNCAYIEKFVRILIKRSFNQSDKQFLQEMLDKGFAGNQAAAAPSAVRTEVPGRVLFLEAVPFFEKRLDTVTEYTNIVQSLANAQLLGRIDIIPPQYNVSLHELLSAMEIFKPNLLHISSHGRGDRLLLMGVAGSTQPVSPEGLRDFLKEYKLHLRCCIFNACDSTNIAKLVSSEIEYVIGYAGAYSDSHALAFSKAFYGQLSRQPNDIARAFLFGQSALRMLDPSVAGNIQLFSKGQSIQP
jgi:hypothetical protein